MSLPFLLIWTVFSKFSVISEEEKEIRFYSIQRFGSDMASERKSRYSLNYFKIYFIKLWDMVNKGMNCLKKLDVLLCRWGELQKKIGFISCVDNVSWPPWRVSRAHDSLISPLSKWRRHSRQVYCTFFIKDTRKLKDR